VNSHNKKKKGTSKPAPKEKQQPMVINVQLPQQQPQEDPFIRINGANHRLGDREAIGNLLGIRQNVAQNNGHLIPNALNNNVAAPVPVAPPQAPILPNIPDNQVARVYADLYNNAPQPPQPPQQPQPPPTTMKKKKLDVRRLSNVQFTTLKTPFKTGRGTPEQGATGFFQVKKNELTPKGEIIGKNLMTILANAGGAVDYDAVYPNYRDEEDKKINPMNYNNTETQFVNKKITNDERERLGLPLVGRPKVEDKKPTAARMGKASVKKLGFFNVEPMTTRQTTKLKKSN
jgi:hypothetical protein